MKHTISVTVENKFGVLARVSGLFSSRGYNIDSLAVGETNNPLVSRMTIVVHGDDRVLDQVIKQLNKLVDVIEVFDMPDGTYVARELCLVKVKSTTGARSEILEVANVFRAKVIDIGHKALTIQITGTEEKVEAFIKLMEPYGIIELIRTGKVAMAREMNSDS
ncbi:MAG: acetolactate synthase small subunit [Candidatus Latescibacterota bacterium]